MSTIHYERLAAELLGLSRRIDGLGSGPQLAFSSIENGAIDEYDENGNLVGTIGEQFDGTHGAISLGGPPPPRPEAPTVENGTAITVGWSGYFVDPYTGERDIMITAPMDWARAEIHLSQEDGFVAESADTLIDTIETPRGGTRPALPGPGVWYAVLVARSLSGKRSEQSAQTRFEVLPGISEEDIQAIRDEYQEANRELNASLAENALKQEQLQSNLSHLTNVTFPALETELEDAGDRLDAADQLLNVTFPKRISDAETAAGNAVTVAGNAQTKASAAETAATAAQTKASAAQTAATAAQTKATAAETSATKASGAAGVAEAAADAAAADAAAALTRATTSGSNATAAQTAATAAQTAANTAKTQATAAGTAAAAADAAAAQAAADAAQAAADLIVARNAAEDAAGKADTAIQRADSAVTAAGSAARVLYSTGTPTGTAREGDTWRRTNGDAGDVIAEWRYTKVGTAAASWKPQKVTTDMISNLDVGKLTAGTAAIVGLVAEKIAAATATIQKADIGNLTVTGTAQLADAVAIRMSAKIGEFIELSTDRLVAGSANLGTAVAEKIAAGVGSFLKLSASQVYIGEAGNVFPADFNDDGWQTNTNVSVSATGGKTGGSSMLLAASTSQIGSYFGIDLNKRSRAPRLIPGMTYLIKANVRSEKAIPVAAARVYVRLYNVASTSTSGYSWATPSAIDNEKAIAANVWGEVEGKITVPEGHPDAVAVFGMYSQATATGTLRFSELTVQPVITPALVVDGLVSGQNIIGALIQTQAAANRGVKILDTGLFAYSSTGVETLRFDGTNSIITGATVRTAASGTRIQISTAGGLEGWAGSTRYLLANASGLEMIGSISSKGKTAETTPRDISVRLTTVTRDLLGKTGVPNPSLVFDTGVGVLGKAAGVYSPTGSSLILAGQTGGVTGYGQMEISEETIGMSARSILLGGGGVYPSDTAELRARNVIVGFASQAFARSITTLFGEVRIPDTLTLGGREMVDSGWTAALAAPNWTHRHQYGWTGVKWRAVGGVFTISGSASKGSWITGENMMQVPAKYLPPSRVMGTGAYVDPATGYVQPAEPGSGSLNFVVSWPYDLY